MNGLTPHLVQYQGSKRLLAPQILSFMPRRFLRLVEPFSGMAAITIAAAKEKRADQYLINDLNKPLIELLRTAIESPNELIEAYSSIWEEQFSFELGSLEHYYKVRDEFNSGNQSAASMLYLIARCVKGAVRYGVNGNFNQSPDKRRHGTSPKSLKANLFAISSLLKGCSVCSSRDYREVLEDTRPGDLVYMDPPYQGVSRVRDSRYFSGIDYNEFVEAIESLNTRGVDYLISYDGKRGEKQYGQDLPHDLGLRKILLNAGLSTQSLLLGKKEYTYEALYISPGFLQENANKVPSTQLSLFNTITT